MKRVLLVENDIVTRMSITQNLKKLGYEVKEAGSLQEAREAIANNIFDILITDTSFGSSVTNESGVEIAKLFREKFPDGKIIAMSDCLRTCWDDTNCNLFIDKTYINRKELLVKQLAKVGIVAE